jgi:hypothetical protein
VEANSQRSQATSCSPVGIAYSTGIGFRAVIAIGGLELAAADRSDQDFTDAKLG